MLILLFAGSWTRHGFQSTPLVPPPARMQPFPAASTHIALNTTRDLADWLRLDPEHLLWFADLQNRNAAATVPLLSHYTTRILAKPYGTIRLLEVPKQRLRSIQRQILTEILQAIPSILPSTASARDVPSSPLPHPTPLVPRSCALISRTSSPQFQARAFRPYSAPSATRNLLLTFSAACAQPRRRAAPGAIPVWSLAFRNSSAPVFSTPGPTSLRARQRPQLSQIYARFGSIPALVPWPKQQASPTHATPMTSPFQVMSSSREEQNASPSTSSRSS